MCVPLKETRNFIALGFGKHSVEAKYAEVVSIPVVQESWLLPNGLGATHTPKNQNLLDDGHGNAAPQVCLNL